MSLISAALKLGRVPFTQAARYVLPKFAGNVNVLLPGFYGNAVSKGLAYGKGMVGGIQKFGRHFVDPLVSKRFQATGITNNTSKILERNIREAAAIHKKFELHKKAFPPTKAGRKAQNIYKELQKEIGGQLETAGNIHSSWYGGYENTLLSPFLRKHFNPKLYSFDKLPNIIAGDSKQLLRKPSKASIEQAKHILGKDSWNFGDNAKGAIQIFKDTPLNQNLRDTQFSRQALNYFKVIDKSKGNTKKFEELMNLSKGNFKKLPDGSYEIWFSPASKSNYTVGGFQGRIRYRPKAPSNKQVEITMSDSFDLGPKWFDKVLKRGTVHKNLLNTMTPKRMKVPNVKEKIKDIEDEIRTVKKIYEKREITKSKSGIPQSIDWKKFDVDKMSFDEAIKTLKSGRAKLKSPKSTKKNPKYYTDSVGKILDNTDYDAINFIHKGYNKIGYKDIGMKDAAKFIGTRGAVGAGIYEAADRVGAKDAGLGLLNSSYEWMSKNMADSSKRRDSYKQT